MGSLWADLQEHLLFIGFSLLVFAVLFVIAEVSERMAKQKRHQLRTARTIACIAMFSAISAVLMLLEVPLFFAPSFYKLDFSELPVLICTFYLGPVEGVVCEFIKVVLKILLKGTTTAFVGDFANFVVGCSLILPASIAYQANPSKKGAALSLVLGTACLTIFGSLFNAWYLIPKFADLYGIPMEAIIGMGSQVNASITDLKTLVLFAVVPFNLLKGTVVSVLTFLLYKRVARVLFRKSK